jgi:low molecular weight protein-tyrosine phosphatase
MIRILFVCLGNICRSPTAEAVFRARAERAGILPYLQLDSCGTGDWHIGKAPDLRAQRAAAVRGYDLSALRARQISPSDFEQFDYILAMDDANVRDILALQAASSKSACLTSRVRIGRFLDYHTDARYTDVPDPYYGGDKGFDEVLDLIETASDGLLASLANELAEHDADVVGLSKRPETQQ